MLPTPFVPLQPVNRPQPAQQSQQPTQNRPRPQSNGQTQQNNFPNPAGFYPYYPTFYPMMPIMPHSVQNSGNSQNTPNANAQLQHALNNMMNRNSFLGFVDPLIIVAIIAIPVIAMLGFR